MRLVVADEIEEAKRESLAIGLPSLGHSGGKSAFLGGNASVSLGISCKGGIRFR